MFPWRKPPVEGPRGAATLAPLLGLVLLPLGAVGLGCDGAAQTAVDAQDGLDDRSPVCLWDVDDLLAEIEVPTPGLDCGQSRSGDPAAIECYTSARERGEAAQVTLNSCIDCLILSTFVSLPDGSELHLYREADYYGDDRRVVRAEACAEVALGSEGLLSCTAPSILYRCVDPLPPPATL